MATGAEVLREARERAGLTQQALAQRAGVTQSVISAYESRRREPSFATLSRLVKCAGFTLEPRLEPAPAASALTFVREHADELRTALGALGAVDIRVFGSVARGDETESSDVDLLVDLEADAGLFALLRMQSAAEAILGRSVDVAPSSGLKPDVAERVLREAVPL
ncbi:MAG TPA: helix-turn-helix domain-containing protein [Agromyces sp.]|nr:helix-turn-helix domain-containing protein [Agromyces sp.]